MIEARSLTKVYGGTAAVDGIDFQAKPGRVTGFLGPNGAGKSTTMRMILGLDLPTSGTVTVGGRRYQGRVWPLHEVGALLDARAVHPGRSAYDHLHSLAAANGIARKRVDEVLEQVGLSSGGRLLPGHVPAARYRRGAARRSGDAAVRRAGQRARSGGDHLDQDAHALFGRGGPHGLRLQPLDERDGPDGGPPAGHRPRPDNRGHAVVGADGPARWRARRGPRR